MAMTKKTRAFILEKLIPFVEREHGNGFCMSSWRALVTTGENLDGEYDGVEDRTCPCDGSVCCIGGSIAILLGIPRGLDYSTHPELAKAIGITRKQAQGLFLSWESDGEKNKTLPFCWPKGYRMAFARAKTAEKKAAVAIRLLREIAEKGGSILANPAYAQ